MESKDAAMRIPLRILRLRGGNGAATPLRMLRSVLHAGRGDATSENGTRMDAETADDAYFPVLSAFSALSA